MYRVKLYKGNVAGDLAESILLSLPNVELIVEGDYDILFSASFPNRITQAECSKARLGAVNLHTGLLPRHRGIHPLNWALIWGDEMTGVTIHKIVDSFDAGDVCLQYVVPIEIDDNIVSLKEKCFDQFSGIITEFFERPETSLYNAWMQNQAEVTYAPKRLPEDSQINLSASPREIYNLFRSCDPVLYPAFTIRNGEKCIIKDIEFIGNEIIVKYAKD